MVLIAGPPPCAPTNGRPGFPLGFLGAGGRFPKARRGRVFIAQFTIIIIIIIIIMVLIAVLPPSFADAAEKNGVQPAGLA